jgi:hypothetical protein
MEHFLAPVLALVLWTFVMWFWFLALRVPAMGKIEPDLQEFVKNPSLMDQLPNAAKWSGNNYNHLHEQPVLFYALMFYLFLTETTPEWICYLAWGYVVTRVLHSIVQSTSNKLAIRFALFGAGSFMLFAMGVGAIMAL